MNIFVKELLLNDISVVAEIHKQSFPRQCNSFEWIKCNYNARPRILIYTATYNSKIVGYIQWLQKSGFRTECTVELEQIAIEEHHRNKGIAKSLISQSVLLLKKELYGRGAIVKNIIITTRSDNHAKKIYETVLGAREVCVIKQLFSGDESILISRNIP